MKTEAQKTFDYYYQCIRSVMPDYFRKRKLAHLPYEDALHDVLTAEKLDKKIKSYDKERANGRSLERWVIFTILQEVEKKLIREKKVNLKTMSIDFSEDSDENKIYSEIESRLVFFPGETLHFPIFIPDMLMERQFELKLISPEEIGGDQTEKSVTKMNLTQAKRLVWTNDKVITEENLQEFTEGWRRNAINSAKHYDNTGIMKILKINTWVACSRIE